MTIVFLTRRFYPLIGGVETHSLEVAKRLSKHGYKIIIITEKIVHDFKNTYITNAEEINGIEIKRIDVGSDDWLKKFRIWKELWKLKSFIRQSDVVHCHDVFFWYLPFRFLYPSKKVYTTFHGYETKFPPEKKAILIRKISEKLSKGNICVGEYIKKWYGSKPDFVVYGGVNKIRGLIHLTSSGQEIKNINSKLKIALIGRLESDIGIGTYVKSLKLLRIKKFQFEFEAHGDGKLKEKLKKYGKVFGFATDANKIFEKTDIIFASSYLILLEALIAKKIIIATYENKLKEDYLKLSPFLKYIYICGSSEECVKVIESIKNTPWKSEAMLSEGYNWASQQTWDKVADIYLRLWNA
ncbi:MAG TPA: glycosyltransferase family 4 protein [Candidatus Saccharimonadales bacterium]|nr:glycosyltransferase family 4 protein [Candidatus Saccharimonadales bacterium]